MVAEQVRRPGRAGDGSRTRVAGLEAVETVVAVAADVRLGMTGWPRDPGGCLRLWPVRGRGHDLESSAQGSIDVTLSAYVEVERGQRP